MHGGKKLKFSRTTGLCNHPQTADSSLFESLVLGGRVGNAIGNKNFTWECIYKTNLLPKTNPMLSRFIFDESWPLWLRVGLEQRFKFICENIYEIYKILLRVAGCTQLYIKSVCKHDQVVWTFFLQIMDPGLKVGQLRNKNKSLYNTRI